MKSGHLNHFEYEEKFHVAGHIKQSEHEEKLHEARTHYTIWALGKVTWSTVTLINLSVRKCYMKPGQIFQSEYE